MMRVALLVTCLASAASAHTSTRSASVWRPDGLHISVAARVPVSEVARARKDAQGLDARGMVASHAEWVAETVTTGLQPSDLAANCVATPGSVSVLSRKELRVAWTLTCRTPPRPGVVTSLFLEQAPDHLHVVAWHIGGTVWRTALTARRPSDALRSDASEASRSIVAFIWVGLVHAGTGLDHIAFVVALALLCGGFREAWLLATGFTLGHALTLGLTAGGVLIADAALVEIFIGVSVAYAALECFHRWDARAVRPLNLAIHGGLALASVPPGLVLGSALMTHCHLTLPTGRRAVMGATLAATFGAVHGLAFSAALAGLDQSAIAPLVGFNLGVELAQLSVVTLTIAGLKAAGARRQVVATGLASLVLALGIGWALSRAV